MNRKWTFGLLVVHCKALVRISFQGLFDASCSSQHLRDGIRTRRTKKGGSKATMNESFETYMHRALELALRGSGKVNPNPLVGAVIVRDGRIIGEGWHTAFGGPHAERHALANCIEDPCGATLCVTLEPCCHTGKTPPCTEAIIESGIARVVMGAPDPNPKVAGGGVAQLEAAGIEVVQGVLVEECLAINKPFFHYIQTGRPYVILKYAMTLDGKIATHTGASRWITGEVARKRVHEDRQRYAAIMVGVNTIVKDDPQLTCRLDLFEGSCGHPARIVCDTRLCTPIDACVVRTAHEIPTYLATSEQDPSKHQPYLDNGCVVLVLPEAEGHVDLKALMDELGSRGIDSVIVEGGATLNWSMISAGLVSCAQVYVAPKIFGGGTAPSPVAGAGVKTPDEAMRFSAPTVTALGDDLLLECEVR